MAISIRPLDPGDAEALHELCTHPEVAADLPEHDPSQPIGWYREWIEATIPNQGFLIGADARGTLVGAAGLELGPHVRRRHAGKAWVAVSPPARRQGTGRALAAAVLEAADRWYHLDRVEAAVPFGAEAGLGLAAELGFIAEVRRRKALWREGTQVDVVHLAWLRPGILATPVDARPGPRPVERWEVRLRAVRPDDARAIAELQSTPSVRWGTLQLPFTPERFWRQRLETNEASQHHLLVAEHDARVVGLGGLHGPGLCRAPHAWALGLSVHADAQGRGVGAALMRGILGLADSWLGAGRVELEVYSDNLRAIALYRSFGFEDEGVRRCDAWRDGGYVDSLCMARLR